jgi:hypothetical protein
MWDCTEQSLNGGRECRYVIRRAGLPVSYRDVLQLWQGDEAFRSFFISLLAASCFHAFRWETPPISSVTASRDFEFVLIDCPGLDQPPDAHSFSKQFESARPNEQIVTFPNLGGDAVLVVPCFATRAENYSHLAAFIRGAPSSQIHEMWQAVGSAMSRRLNTKQIWLSTAGMGVSWLHVRLDSRPKYYAFAEYRQV